MRSAAADQPARFPEYKITWFWGVGVGGHGKHTRSTAADQPALLPDYKIAWFCGGGGGWFGGGHDNELLHPSKFISFWGWGVGWGGG